MFKIHNYPPPCPSLRGPPGRVRGIVWLSEVWFSVFLRGPQPISRLTREPIFRHFLHYFFRPVFDHHWCQKVPKWESQKSTKSLKSRKTRHQNAFLIETCKKTPFGRGQTSEFDDSCTLLAVFSKAQGSQKGVEMEPKWSFRIPQIT